MRNLTVVCTPDTETLMRRFRSSFMEKTATWSVLVEVVDNRNKAYDLVEGNDDAYVITPRFEDVLFNEADFPSVPSEIVQGCDILARSGPDFVGMSLLGKTTIQEIEDELMPIYDARVVIFGTDSLALDCAYHAARAGVSEIVLLDSQRDRALNNTEAFMDSFAKMRNSAVDTDQATFGHLSIKRAYENCDIKFGIYDKAVRLTSRADIVINACPHTALSVSFLSRLEFKENQIICDLYDGDNLGPVISLSKIAQSDCVDAQAVYARWGSQCATTLVDLTREGL